MLQADRVKEKGTLCGYLCYATVIYAYFYVSRVKNTELCGFFGVNIDGKVTSLWINSDENCEVLYTLTFKLIYVQICRFC